MSSLKLSVLDQSPIHNDKEAKQGLFDTIELAKNCEKWGYYRYWCAEHHDTPGYASACPEIMISSDIKNPTLNEHWVYSAKVKDCCEV